jgi:hypothetical protein
VTDALSQVKQYSYANDNRLLGITYANAVNPTPNVTFTYDPYFTRLVSMTDGTGTTQYAYGGRSPRRVSIAADIEPALEQRHRLHL